MLSKNKTLATRKGGGKRFTFNIGPSQAVKRWLFMIHGLALAACFIASLSMAMRLLLGALIGGSFIFNLKRYTGNNTYLKFQSTEGWSFSVNGKDFETIVIGEGTVYTPFFIILCFYRQRRKAYLCVLPDAINRGNFRRLTVLLKINGVA